MLFCCSSSRLPSCSRSPCPLLDGFAFLHRVLDAAVADTPTILLVIFPGARRDERTAPGRGVARRWEFTITVPPRRRDGVLVVRRGVAYGEREHIQAVRHRGLHLGAVALAPARPRPRRRGHLIAARANPCPVRSSTPPSLHHVSRRNVGCALPVARWPTTSCAERSSLVPAAGATPSAAAWYEDEKDLSLMSSLSRRGEVGPVLAPSDGDGGSGWITTAWRRSPAAHPPHA
jgi:hypothetical protein